MLKRTLRGATRDCSHAVSLAEFMGYEETAGVGLSFGPIGGSYAATQSVEGDRVAEGDSLGYLLGQPSAFIPNMGFSGTATVG